MVLTCEFYNVILQLLEGQSICNSLRTLDSDGVSCEFIFSGSPGQDVIAKKWNDNLLRVLISTTLGLVGNECSKTQLVCIVGLMYNIPSIVQSIGRIRPKRRNANSQCRIYTAMNHKSILRSRKEECFKMVDELIGCNIVSKDCKGKYLKSMTVHSVNGWLFHDQGCRMVSLSSRLGFEQSPCRLCDRCTDTCVNRAAVLRKKQLDSNKVEKESGIRLLSRLKQKCLVCNNTSCSGTCLVRNRSGLVCFHCLGSHVASKCPKAYRTILKNKACYSCYKFNYSEDCIHHFTECSKEGQIKERLRCLIQHDYQQKKKNRRIQSNFEQHLSGIYASEVTFFKFLYHYRDWK